MVCPVTNEAASEQSQTTASAISSGCPPVPWDDGQSILPPFGIAQAFDHRRANIARTDTIDPNPLLGIFQRRSFGEPHDPMLARHIG